MASRIKKQGHGLPHGKVVYRDDAHPLYMVPPPQIFLRRIVIAAA